jgi:mono/diheme cytochrome c family protein
MVRASALASAVFVIVMGVRVAGGAQDRTTWDGVYTEAQADRGEGLYKEHCIRCHGAALQGNGEGALPLTGATFGSTWNGVTLGAMMERVRLSMPQDKPATMSRQQIADLLAFVLRANKFPAGDAELPRQTDILNTVVFKRER